MGGLRRTQAAGAGRPWHHSPGVLLWPAAPSPGPRPHLGYLSERLPSGGSVPGAGPSSSDSGPHMSEADASLCTLRSSVPASKQETGPRGSGGCGEPKQADRAPGREQGLGRTSPSSGGEVGT